MQVYYGIPDTPDVGNRRHMIELYDGIEREDSEGDLRTVNISGVCSRV